MKFGFAKTDITPRVGVELSGFGPYLHRQSVAVRDRLSARAMAVSDGRTTIILASLDLLLVSRELTEKVRKLVKGKVSGACEVVVHCTHTHSGPAVLGIEGWGEVDVPYCELLPSRIAETCIEAAGNMREMSVSHAEVPCVGIGLNREYDKDAPPIEEVMRDDWRPAKPELTDTTCHVLKFESEGKTVGFVSHFGCHPVVCCQKTRYIHGDYCGVATNILENENPGTVGLFLQGALGDVNSCCVHKPEKESLEALDVIAARYVKAVQEGFRQSEPIEIEKISFARSYGKFTRRTLDAGHFRRMLEEKESLFLKKDASDQTTEIRMAAVYVTNLRKLVARLEKDAFRDDSAEIDAIQLGPIAIFATPFEVFQAIRNDVKKQSKFKTPWVLSVTNEYKSYAPDGTASKRGGYAADQVPMMIGEPPYADIHGELVKAIIELEKKL